MRGGHGETEKQRDRETERQRDRETERQRDRERQIEVAGRARCHDLPRPGARGPQNSPPLTLNHELETREPKTKTRKPEPANQKPITENRRPKIQNPKLKTENVDREYVAIAKTLVDNPLTEGYQPKPKLTVSYRLSNLFALVRGGRADEERGVIYI